MHGWVMSNTSTIKASLYRSRLSKGWEVQLEEIFQDDTTFGHSILDERVAWADSLLREWNCAHRSSWDAWYFDTKKDAEKFIIIYNLRWA